jgi:hypothetical protein
LIGAGIDKLGIQLCSSPEKAGAAAGLVRRDLLLAAKIAQRASGGLKYKRPTAPLVQSRRGEE